MKVQRLTVETIDDIIIEYNGWYKLMYNPRELCIYITIEYNTDTSAGHPVEDDDIVRYSEEIQRVKDKEP